MGFSRDNGVLTADGVRLDELAAAHGTPLYVYSAARVHEALRSYAEAFAGVPHQLCYALKANANGALLRLVAASGAGADIVSGGELQAALRAGFRADRIVFSGVGKTEAEMRAGIAHGIGAFNAESEEEILALSRLAVEAGRTVRVALRVNPDIDPGSHPYVSTGQAHNKFGVDIARAPEIFRRAVVLPAIRLVGLQCHIGSQITDVARLGESATALADASRRLLADGFALETVNIGGGLGFDYRAADEARERPGALPVTPRALAESVLPRLRDLGLTVLVEPGRSLMAGAGVLLARVLQVKAGAHRFVIVDAAMNDLIRPALYGAWHRIEPVVDRCAPAEVVDVVGPVCESGDFLARDREMPGCRAGDLLAVRDAGAYSFSMASTYNMRPRPAEVLVEEGRARLVRRRQGFDDLVREEV
jgi:diaminopimelate decarboxylase